MDEQKQLIRWSQIEPLCVLRLLLAKWWLLVLSALIGVMGAAVILSFTGEHSYTSSTTFAVTSRGSGSYYTHTTVASEVVSIYSELLQSRFMDDIIRQGSGEALSGTVKATQLGQTNLLRVTVTSASPRDALLMMQTVLARYDALSEYVNATATLIPLNTPNVTVASRQTIPMKQGCAIAGAAGLVLMAVILLWISVTSGTIQTAEGAKNNLDAPVIAEVPHEKKAGERVRLALGKTSLEKVRPVLPRKKKGNPDDLPDAEVDEAPAPIREPENDAEAPLTEEAEVPAEEKTAGAKRLRRQNRNDRRPEEIKISSPTVSFAFTEAVHRIATKFEHARAKGKTVFLFSSVSAAEGKSTLAANTALSLAERKDKVLFIDLDLRSPVQSGLLGLQVEEKKELGAMLAKGKKAETILKSVVVDPVSGMHSLLSNQSYRDMVELISSSTMAQVIALGRERYDYVIIDLPPMGLFSDSELLSDLADASVLVVRQDVVPAPEINDAIDELRCGKAEFLGCILNDMRHLNRRSGVYGYGYGGKYGHGYGYGKYGYGKYGYGNYERSGRNSENKND